MYDVVDYGLMTADRIRMEAYSEALRRTVKPGSVVIDIGTGTGIFALLACRFGARRVYAIEPNDAIVLAREVAAANGYAERIEFIQDISTKVVLSERADVIVSDIRGIVPLFQQHIPTIIDARQRLLAPEGVLIPQRDTLWAAVVETPDSYGDFTGPWDGNVYGFDLRAARNVAVNSSRKAHRQHSLLTEPKCWATLDYPTLEDSNVSAELCWPISRKGTGHGLNIWFDSVVAEDLHLTNSPTEPLLAYGQAFFPWTEPVNLDVGDTVTVLLQANLIGDYYVWRWDTRVSEQGNPGRVKADFKQSTFHGSLLRPTSLQKLEAGYLPNLTEDGHLDRLVLELMSERRALGDIAKQIQEQFPQRFPEWHDALDHVCELSAQYSE